VAADLLDRGTQTPVEDSSVDQELTLRRPTRVLRVFAARNRSGAWAYLDEIGWRRVTAPTPTRARDLLSALCRARLSGAQVGVEVTGTGVLAVTEGPDDLKRPLPLEPRLSGLRRRAVRRPDVLRAGD
jgi:hypothetical protein